jgi:hypothetical protein
MIQRPYQCGRAVEAGACPGDGQAAGHKGGSAAGGGGAAQRCGCGPAVQVAGGGGGPQGRGGRGSLRQRNGQNGLGLHRQQDTLAGRQVGRIYLQPRRRRRMGQAVAGTAATCTGVRGR